MTAARLAALLKPFEVGRSGPRATLWIDDGTGTKKSVKGYRRSEFEDAWSRYLPQSAASSGESGENQHGYAEKRAFRTGEKDTSLTARNEAPNPHGEPALTALTAHERGTLEECEILAAVDELVQNGDASWMT